MGLLAGIGALAIPGVGPIIAAGPIMGALAGLGVGGAVGGLVGALIDLERVVALRDVAILQVDELVGVAVLLDAGRPVGLADESFVRRSIVE